MVLFCIVLRSWLRRAGCVSQDAYILHDNNLPFESRSYKDFVMKHWSSDYSLYELAQTTRFSSGLKNMRIYPTALSINLNKYDPWSLFAKPKIN